MIFRVDKNAAISSVAACNNNKKKEKKKKNNTKKKKKKKTRQISTRRCVVGCLQAAVSQDHHIVLCACARAGHMTYTNAHITIHSPYSIAGVRSSTICKQMYIISLQKSARTEGAEAAGPKSKALTGQASVLCEARLDVEGQSLKGLAHR